MKKENRDTNDLLDLCVIFVLGYLLMLRELTWYVNTSTELLFYGFILPGSFILTAIMLLPIIQGFIFLGILIYNILKGEDNG